MSGYLMFNTLFQAPEKAGAVGVARVRLFFCSAASGLKSKLKLYGQRSDKYPMGLPYNPLNH